VEIDPRLYNFLRDLYGQRFVGSLTYLVTDIDSVVTRDQGFIEVSGVVKAKNDKTYACYINPKEFFCGCMDNFVRKTVCKHIIAVLIEAFRKDQISKFEFTNLLAWRKKYAVHNRM